MNDSKGQVTTANGINIVLAIWLIIAPFVLSYVGTTPLWNDIVLGVLIGIVGIVRMISPTRSTNWLNWLSVAFGVWLIIAPFVLSYANVVPLWNDIILGIGVAVVSFWGLSVAGGSQRRISHV